MIGFTLVVIAVVLYLRADRTEAENSEAEYASMYDQQGGGSESLDESQNRKRRYEGYRGDWEWDSNDEDEDAMKHLLAQEEDQALGFIPMEE